YVIGERRRTSRATLSHSTLEVDGAEQAEIWAAHRMGGRPRVELVDFQSGSRIEATCSGWSDPSRLHRRIFMLQEGALEIRDRMEGSPAPVRLSLPLAPGIRVRTVHDADGGAEVYLELPSGRRMRVMLPVAAQWRLEPCAYFPRFGVELERTRILGEAPAFESGTWRFELLD
ncbi:MAG: heparinase II/III family protein, partial [Myxococcota bacterium]